MFNKLMNWVVPKLEAWCVKTGRVHTIMGRPGTELENSPYLIRHFLFRSKLFSIYLHRFMRSDEGDHHDHPFNFISYLVKGEYTESLYNWSPNHNPLYWLDSKTLTKRKQGSIAYRKATDTHMVFIDKAYDLNEKENAICTLVFRGPEIRNWGFYIPLATVNFFAPFERVSWQEYLNKTEKDFE